jgi:hypothetical protein
MDWMLLILEHHRIKVTSNIIDINMVHELNVRAIKIFEYIPKSTERTKLPGEFGQVSVGPVLNSMG